MNIQVLTDAPGGYVAMDTSDLIGADRWRTGQAVRMRFRNGDFVIVSGETARSLGRLGIIPSVLN
jgi:hypothetical protein